MNTKYYLSVLVCIALLTSVKAQVPQNIEGDAGILFAYYPKEGKEAQFNEGYKSHLEWHREHNDPFVWYGWYVLSGDRVGMFIDGTFGISFEAFDNRVAPAQDAAHFQQSTAPYADVAYRKVFKHLPGLSMSTRLENQNPSRYLDAYAFSIVPGKEPQFEEVISKLVSKLKEEDSGQEFSIYRQLTGGSLPAYLVMVAHDGFSDFDSDETATTLSHLIRRAFDKSTSGPMLDRLSQSVKSIHGETWLYRRDLSYFPED